MARRVRVWTWDLGSRDVDLDGDPALLAQTLQTVLDGGLWRQLRKFPVAAVERVLPRLHLPAHRRRLVEIWIEETARPAA